MDWKVNIPQIVWKFVGSLTKWSGTTLLLLCNIVPIFNRGLPKAVPINMHLGCEGNIHRKILTPQNEAEIGTHTR